MCAACFCACVDYAIPVTHIAAADMYFNQRTIYTGRSVNFCSFCAAEATLNSSAWQPSKGQGKTRKQNKIRIFNAKV